MPHDAVDPYLYPGTSVLQNKFAIRDEDTLKTLEYEHTELRIDELHIQPINGKFDLSHLCAIHAYIFQDIYDWAGKVRSLDIAKTGSYFAHFAYIETEAKRIAGEFAQENNLRNLKKTHFVERLAYYYGEWNALHPFREGNGRSIREFIFQLSLEAGYLFDQTGIDNSRDQWNTAAIAGMSKVYDPIIEIFTNVIACQS
jgi:cell filamentation protein